MSCIFIVDKIFYTIQRNGEVLFLDLYWRCEIFSVNRSSMIIAWEQMEFFAICSLDLYITRIRWHVKSGSIFGAVHLLLI